MRYLIVDANLAAQVFGGQTIDFQPVRDALFGRRDRLWGLAHGGQLTREMWKVDEARRAVLELDRAGRAALASESQVASEVAVIMSLDALRSNDPHVIAVARCTGARLLCTQDNALASDFGDRKLIDSPRGKVYRNATHAHLLRYR